MADFEAGSILVAFRTFTADLKKGLRRGRTMLNGFASAVGGVATRVKKAAASMRSALAPVTRLLTRFGTAMKIAFVVQAAAAIKFASDFDSSMSKIVGLVGVGRDQVNAWREDLLKMGAEVGKGPGELADALFFLTSAGLRGKEAIDALTASAQAATAGLGETKDIGRAVASVLNAYADQNLNAADATGILVAAVREGTAEANEIAPALGRVLPIASQLGVGFDEVAASIAAMSTIGLDANEAVTALRGILNTIINPTSEATRVMKELGISSGDLKTALDEGGVLAALNLLKDASGGNLTVLSALIPEQRALTGALSLVGKNAERTKEIFESLAKAGVGDLTAAFEEAETTFRVKWAKAWAKMTAGLIRLGNVILPFLLPLLQKFAGMFDSLSQKVAGFAAAATEVFRQLQANLSGGGIADIMSKLANAIGETIINVAASVRDFLAAEGPEMVKVFFKSIAVIIGPATLKVMGIVVAEVKGGLTRILNFLAFSFFDLPRELLFNFLEHMQALMASTIADIMRTLITAFESTGFGQALFSAEDFNNARAMASLVELSGAEARKNARTVQEVVTETLLKAKNASEAIAKQVTTDVDLIVSEIDQLKVDLVESGVSRDVSDEIVRIFKSGLDASSGAIRKALGGITTEFEFDMDAVVAKLQAAQLAVANLQGSPDGSISRVITDETDKATDAAAEKATVKIHELASTLGQALGSAVIDGLLEGEKGITILADFGKALFRKTVNNLVNSFEVLMSKALEGLGVEAQGVVSGVLNAALAVVGFLLSQLDKADSSKRFGRLEPEVSSSQLVRGVVAGPQNVAIAEVGENLKRALIGVENRLDAVISVLVSIRDKSLGSGAPPVRTAGTQAV